MTNTANATANANVTAKALGMTRKELESIKHWLDVTRVEQCSQSLEKWLRIGDVCSRIKVGDFEGKFKDNVDSFFDTTISNDERQYSMKIFDLKKDLVKWYSSVGCMKYNPRTIYTAFMGKDTKVLTKEEKAEAKAKDDAAKAEKEGKKERTSLEVMQSYTAYAKMRDNAHENGNMLLADWELLAKALKSELELVNGMVKIETKAEAVKTEKGKKAA